MKHLFSVILLTIVFGLGCQAQIGIDSIYSTIGMMNKSHFTVAETDRYGHWHIPNGDSMMAYRNIELNAEGDRYAKLYKDYNKLIKQYNSLRKLFLDHLNDDKKLSTELMNAIKNRK